jgi:ubiquitin-protein ligase
MEKKVIEQWREMPLVCEFLLRNAYTAMLSPRSNIIFNPYPKSWKTTLVKDTKTKNTINCAELLTDSLDISLIIKDKKIITDFNIILTAINGCYDDVELKDKLNESTYELIKFILESNKVMIKADNLLNSNDMVELPIEISSTLSKDEIVKYEKSIINNINQYKVIHTQLVEDRFIGKKTKHLYHGSCRENWYSIMSNGIKIGSKNKYFMNGAAHGNGIYLSNDINMSLGYSIGYNLNASSRTKDQIILAIFEVIDNPKWYKTDTIFVVDDENALLLRYLIVFNHNQQISVLQSIFKSINRKLNSGGIKIQEQKQIEMAAKNITIIHNKRLMKEYQAIMKKSHEVLGFQVRLAEEDQLSKWLIYITRSENPKLEEQMQRLGIQAIEIEIIFKENYPIAPPFIRVVYPHFKFHSGHITVGGSLCMEMLTNQGWSPTFNVENVITQIKLAISDGGGEIDEANYKRRYTMEEALEAFKRVMASHGWV